MSGASDHCASVVHYRSERFDAARHCERRGPRIAFQVLFYPVTDARFDTASYTQFAEGPWLTRKAMEWFWDSYAPDVAVRNEPASASSADEEAALPGAEGRETRRAVVEVEVAVVVVVGYVVHGLRVPF